MFKRHIFIPLVFGNRRVEGKRYTKLKLCDKQLDIPSRYDERRMICRGKKKTHNEGCFSHKSFFCAPGIIHRFWISQKPSVGFRQRIQQDRKSFAKN